LAGAAEPATCAIVRREAALLPTPDGHVASAKAKALAASDLAKCGALPQNG
jgi:hypothetical protein